MFLTMGDLRMGELEVGATARGSFTAALPRPPVRHMWEMIPGTEEASTSGGRSTFLYRLVRYEADPAPIVFRPSTEAEIIAEMNANDPDFVKLQQTVARNEAQAQANAAAVAIAPSALVPSLPAPYPLWEESSELSKPWYKKPVVLGGIGVGVVLAGVAAVLLMQD